MSKVYLAVDLGAGSGRVIAGLYDGARLALEEVHRFANDPVDLPSGMHWDLTGLYRNAREGLDKAVRRWGEGVRSVGVDTWGVDYGFVAGPESGGALLGLPFIYRDPRTDGMIARAESILEAREIYGRTGIQTMFFNTLYQLLAEVGSGSPAPAAAHRLLFIPDLLNYFLTGEMTNERTIASTSQLYNPMTRDWDWELIEKMGIPKAVFHSIIDPGVVLGKTLVEGREINVVAVGSHDTASAVAAVPMQSDDAAYLSSGTWSLLGAELAEPVITDESFEINFTNETGVGDTIRFLKNITGMWLIQQCKETWDQERGEPIDYGELTAGAREAEAFQGFLDPDDPAFVAPGDMPKRIADYLKEHGQPAPADSAQMTRVILESLALKYRYVLELMERTTGRQYGRLHVVGGGCRNDVLNQFTANALGRPVIAGPAEATSAGNVLIQLIADGEVADIAEGRKLVADSFPARTFEPAAGDDWANAFESYKSKLGLK